MNKALTRVLVPVLLCMGIVVVGASTATAHTPSISASCTGVTVSGTNYGGDGFDWSITVGGDTQTGHSGDNGSKTIPVPQGGATTSWSASIDAPGTQYDASDSGSVGPCGQVVVPPKPNDEKETRDKVNDPNCRSFTVTTEHQERTRTHTLVNNVWVAGPWSDWTTTSTDSRDATLTECPPPPRPNPRDVQEVEVEYKCGDDFKTVTTTTTVTDWVLNPVTREWYLTDPVTTVDVKKVSVPVKACPKPPVDEPKKPEPPTATPVLPDTGGAPLGLLLIGSGLTAAGGLLVRRSLA